VDLLGVAFDVEVSSDPSWEKFDAMAATLCAELPATVTSKLDGVDERYWDFLSAGTVFTLHLEPYLGIVLLAPRRCAVVERALAMCEPLAKLP
jgi:hypothetical protein